MKEDVDGRGGYQAEGYAFFGFSTDGASLEGELEAGIEAPPEEEQAWEEEEDMSFVPMFEGFRNDGTELESTPEEMPGRAEPTSRADWTVHPYVKTEIEASKTSTSVESLHTGMKNTQGLNVMDLEGKLRKELNVSEVMVPPPPMPVRILSHPSQGSRGEDHVLPSVQPRKSGWSQPRASTLQSFEDVQRIQSKESQDRFSSHRPKGPKHGRRTEGLSSRKCPDGRVKYHSRYMSEQETDQLVRIHWAATHQGLPYFEDHYAMSVEAKKHDGHIKGFAPQELPELLPQQRAGMEGPAFVELQGLGRVPFSNIRRPRPIMDIIRTSTEAEGEETQVTRLEQEPLLAARIMIEDGMCLLLDVDDTSRMIRELEDGSGTETDKKSLLQRQEVLLEGLASSMHLAGIPDLSTTNDPIGDKVFHRLLMLPKGKALVSMYLARTTPGTLLAQRLIWASLRSLDALFGDEEKINAEAMHQVVGRQVIGRVPTPASGLGPNSEVAKTLAQHLVKLDKLGCVAALVALVAGCRSREESKQEDMLPLRPSLAANYGSLADGGSHVLCSLLSHAAELGLQCDPKEEDKPVHQAWKSIFESFVSVLCKHLEVLLERYAASKTSNLEECAAIKQDIPVALIRAVIPLASSAQQDQLRLVLVKFD